MLRRLMMAGAADTLLQAAFSVKSSDAYFDLQPAALVYNHEQFVSDTGQFTRLTEGTMGAFTVTGGQGVIAHAAGSAKNDIILAGAEIGQPQFCATIDVASRSGAPSGYDNIGVGIAKDANNFIFAGLDMVSNNLRVQTKIGGSNNFHAGVYAPLTPPFSLGLSIVGNRAVIWTNSGSGWVARTHYDFSGRINLKTASLAGWRPAFTMATPGNSTWAFENFRSGRFGAVGLRDLTLVTEEDGSPYEIGGEVYFTATAAYPWGEAGTSYTGVFRADMSARTIVQTAVVQISRGGAVHNDQAAHIVHDASGDMHLLISTWGNGFGGSLQVLHKLTNGTALLNGSHVVSGMTQLTLPDVGAGGAYDPYLVKIAGTWNLAYTITDNTSFSGSPFYAALATSPDLTIWSLVGKDSANKGWEGTKIIKDGEAYRVAVGGPAGSGTSSRVYNMSMSYLGAMNAAFSGGADTQPHPMAFKLAGAWHMLSFDATRYPPANQIFSWGKPIFYGT